ncbi:MAG: hypothetical protein IPP17_26685 [Bacteroidetes bacterium]|nr:hypothetical protein [Bacteroidota bacterium]
MLFLAATVRRATLYAPHDGRTEQLTMVPAWYRLVSGTHYDNGGAGGNYAQRQ